MYLQNVISRKLFKKLFFVSVLKVNDENSRIKIRVQYLVRGADLDTYKNVTDPQHCSEGPLFWAQHIFIY
jgi:hypothetical protein